MIDLLLVSETLGSTPSADELRESVRSRGVGPWILAGIISCIAAYVSWTCNTSRGISVPMKIIFAFFAFLFGSLYLTFYAIFVTGYCGA